MNPINLTDIEVEGLKMVDHHSENNPNPNPYSNDYSVFPPINHENLTHQPTPQSPSPSPSSSSSSSCLTTESDTWVDPNVQKGADFPGWLTFGLHFLRSKLPSFRNPGAFRSIGWVLLSCWILIIMAKKNSRRRRRRRRSISLTPNENHLINIIKEKDGRIAQLLNQIAQMNEILIARHKALAAKVVE